MMQDCCCFYSYHCCVKLPISMCTSKQKASQLVAFEVKITVNFMLCPSKRNVAKRILWLYVKFQFALANG